MTNTLSDITLRTNNTHRQITLFDALGSVQRRAKRQRRSIASENGGANNEESDRENTAPNHAKRQRSGPKSPKSNCKGNIERKTAQLNTFRANPGATTFRALSIHSAYSLRQYRRVDFGQISTIDRLSSFVSPSSSIFRLYAQDDIQVPVLPLACKYARSVAMRSKVALVDEGGMVSIFDINRVPCSEVGRHLTPLARWKSHNNATFDVEWSLDDRRLVTASADETCVIWDIETQQALGEFRGHTQTVRSVSWKHDDPNCFVSGSRDGSVMVWDVRCNTSIVDGLTTHRPVNTIHKAHFGTQVITKIGRSRTKLMGGSVTSVQWLRHNSNTIASVGSTSEIVKFWDVRKNYSSRALNHLPVPEQATLRPSSGKRSRGTSSLTLDPDGTRIYSACNDNSVYVNNTLCPGHPITRLLAPEFECHSFNITTSISPCSRYLAVGSSNGNVIVWELDRYGFNTSGKRAVLQGHVKEAGCVAWYPGLDCTQLITCGDDGTMRVWDVDFCMSEEGRTDPMKRCQWGFAEIKPSHTKCT